MSKQAAYTQQMASYHMANTTVQKTRQLVMLYDAVIRNLKQARLAIEEKRIQDRYNLLAKAADIISGLSCSLDYEKGGEISQMLGNYYFAMHMRMMGLNGSNSTADCDGIILEVKMMRDAWDKIDQELSQPIGAAKAAENTTPAEKIIADFNA